MSTKISYWTRNGTKVENPSDLLMNAVEAKKTETIYSIKDVIDVVFITADPDAISISPTDFKPFADLIGESDDPVDGNRNWDDYSCLIDNKRPIASAPAQGRFLHYDVSPLNKRIESNEYRNGWAKEGKSDRMPIGNRWNIVIDYLKKIDKKNYFWPNDPKFAGCSEFSMLFQDTHVISNLIEAGYQLPRPRNFTHRCNWFEFTSLGRDSYSCYFIVMVLTVPTVLARAQLFNPAVSLNGTLLTALDISNSTTAKATISETCSTLPSAPPKGNYKNFPFRYECVWPFEGSDGHSGRYYMGDSLKSVNNKWRLMLTAHGDLWLQDVSAYKLVAGFGSASIDTIRATFELRRNGDIAIVGRTTTQILWNVNLYGYEAYLSITDSGILVVRAFKDNMFLWSNKTSNVNQHGNKLKDYFTDPIFYFASETSFTPNTTRYSPNLRYSLSFQADGNLVLRDISTNTAIWHPGTHGKGKELRIQKDGNIVIYDSKKVAIWATGTSVDNTSRVILVADNNGAVVVMAKSGNDWVNKWSQPLSEWNALYGGGGSTLGSWTPYLSKNGEMYEKKGVPKNDEDSSINISTFNSRACSADKYKAFVDQSSRIATKAAYCMTGYNLIVDRETCNIFSADKKPLGDGEAKYKTQVDEYVKSSLCKDGYDKTFAFSPNLQNELNKFCSCVAPLGFSRQITANNNTNVTPICFDMNCTSDGYKTIATLEAKDVCPSCMCVNSVDATNTRILSSGIKQTCPTTMECTKIDSTTTTTITGDSTTVGQTNGGGSTNNSDTGASTNTGTNATNNSSGSSTNTDTNTGTNSSGSGTGTNTGTNSSTNATNDSSASGAGTTPAANDTPAASDTETKWGTAEYAGIGIGVFVFFLFILLLIMVLKRRTPQPGMYPMQMQNYPQYQQPAFTL